MKKILSFIVSFAVLISMLSVIPTGSVFAVTPVTYYIDPAGSNSNNGTSSSTPWANFVNISTTTFNSGDMILLKRGCTFTATAGNLTLATINGSGVTVDAYGTGANPVISSGGYTGVIAFGFYDRDNMTFQNLSFNNIGLVTNQYAYTTFNHTGLTFRNLNLTNTGLQIANKIAPSDNGKTLISNVVLDNIVSTNSNNTSSININTYLTTDTEMPMTSDQSIKNMYIHNVIYENTQGCALSLTNCSNVVLSSVYIYYDCTVRTPQGTTAVFLWMTNGVKFINCYLANTPNTGATDQCSVDNEAYIYANVYEGCYIGYNAGAGLEFLHLTGRTNDYNLLNQVNSCTFQNNAQAGNSTYKSSLLDISQTGTYSSGTASNNVYQESTGFTTIHH